MKDSIGNSVNPYKASTRGWLKSIIGSLLITFTGVIASMVINPLIERSTAWGWLSGISAILFILSTIGIRRKWL